MPTGFGEFSLYLCAEQGKEHLALVKGDVRDKAGAPHLEGLIRVEEVQDAPRKPVHLPDHHSIEVA